VLVGAAGDLVLEEAPLDGLGGASEGVDALKQRERLGLELVRERLDVVAPGERVDRLRRAALVASTCCVRSASVAASAVGSASASS
jgi:hypothetical protein